MMLQVEGVVNFKKPIENNSKLVTGEWSFMQNDGWMNGWMVGR